jgi:hypothetical protein
MKYILLLLPLLLTGCSALGLISSVIPDGGTDVNANAQIGGGEHTAGGRAAE